MSDLDETMREFGPWLDQLGLLPEQSVELIGQAMSAGATDARMPANALKEFLVRVLDDSAATARGFDRLGLDVAEVARAFAEDAFQRKEALGATLDALREVDDSFERHQAAVDLFGVSAEDLGDALFAMEVP